MNHTRFPKEDHLPYWSHWDNKDTKGDRADQIICNTDTPQHVPEGWVQVNFCACQNWVYIWVILYVDIRESS